MIAHLKGKLTEKNLEGLVVDVGGVGFGVLVSAVTLGKLPRQGEPCFLYVHTNLHDRGIDLFGFYDALERRVFRLLIGIPGIGPRVALGILSAVEVPDLMEAVRCEDVKRLTMIPGIGKKTAQRLVVELQEKLAKISFARPEALSKGDGALPEDDSAPIEVGALTTSKDKIYRDVHSALCNMGYKVSQVDKVIMELRKKDLSDELKLEDALKAALKLLHRVPDRRTGA